MNDTVKDTRYFWFGRQVQYMGYDEATKQEVVKDGRQYLFCIISFNVWRGFGLHNWRDGHWFIHFGYVDIGVSRTTELDTEG